MDPFFHYFFKNLVPGLLGEFDGVFRSQFSRFTLHRFSRIRILRCTTQWKRLLQYSNWSLCTTFLRLLVGGTWHLSPCIHSFFRLVIQTHERVSELTWRIFTEFESAWKTLLSNVFSCLQPDPSEGFCPSPSVCLPSNGMREKTIALFVSDTCDCFQRLGCHDWNYMSLLWNIVQVSSTENTLPLSSQRKLAFLPFWLLVTALFSTTSLQTLKFRVLIIWSIWTFTAVLNCWQFGVKLFRATSWSHNAITVWCWEELSSFDLYNPDHIWGHFTHR